MSDILYPEIVVQLSEEDVYPILLIKKVRKSLKEGGVNRNKIELFTHEALKDWGGKGHVIRTVMAWVKIKFHNS